jgi:hypothetical protein
MLLQWLLAKRYSNIQHCLALRQDDAAVHVPVQALLEYSATQVIGLTHHDLRDRCAQFFVSDMRLSCRPGKPGRPENPCVLRQCCLY